MAKRFFPRANEVFTFKQIVEELDLRDSPCLTFSENEISQNIQDAHINEHDILALPHWAESRWKFVRETDERIPIFVFAKDNQVSIDELVDKEPEIDPFAKEAGHLWVVPKGAKRDQWYRIVYATETEAAYIIDGSGERYAVPLFDENGKSNHFYREQNNAGQCDNCKGHAEKRFGYRDFEEGSSAQLREVCRPCLDSYHAYVNDQLD